jgi:transposase
MALGEISAIEQKVSAALEQPVQEAQEYAQSQSAAGADETSWPQGTRKGERKAWLWVMGTSLVSVFMILRHRSTEAAKTLLGGFRGILTTDRWWAYLYHGLRRRQLCWAHLIRDFQEMTERRDRASQKTGESLLEEAKEMFAWWHRVREGTLSRSSFQTYMGPLRRRVRQRLRQATRCRNKLTARTCRDLLKLFPALWTFVRVQGVEPTNNACERALRPAVLWRKGCFGTRSEAGSRFAARMLTTVATLKQQGRNLLEFLTLAVQRYQADKPIPSLLPDARLLARLQAAS